LQLGLLLFYFGFKVSYFVTLLNADVAVLSLLLVDLADLGFEVRYEALESLLLSGLLL
jgi:hypothetical protein